MPPIILISRSLSNTHALKVNRNQALVGDHANFFHFVRCNDVLESTDAAERVGLPYTNTKKTVRDTRCLEYRMVN